MQMKLKLTVAAAIAAVAGIAAAQETVVKIGHVGARPRCQSEKSRRRLRSVRAPVIGADRSFTECSSIERPVAPHYRCRPWIGAAHRRAWPLCT